MKLLKTTAVSVGTSAVAAVPVNDVAADTKSLVIQNHPSSAQNLFVVHGSGIAKTQGLVIIPGASLTVEVSDGSSVYLISDSGTLDVRVGQVGL